MKATKTWKTVELRIAKDFGVERTPLSGINSKHTGSDTLHETFYVEVKHGKNHIIEMAYKLWRKFHIIHLKSFDGEGFMYHKEDIMRTVEMGLKMKPLTVFRTNSSIMTLYRKTAIKARAENKISLVALHATGATGYLIISKAEHIAIIRDELIRIKELKEEEDGTSKTITM